MVAVEAAAGHAAVPDHDAQLLQHAPGVRQHEFAPGSVLVQRGSGHQGRGQGTDEGWIHGRQQFRRGRGVLGTAISAAQPQHHHHRVAKAGLPEPRGRRHRIGRRGSLDDPFESDVVAAFGAVVDDAQARLAQPLQFRGGLVQDAAGVAIDAHAAQQGQLLAEAQEDPLEVVGGQDQRVAVAQEHPANGLSAPLVDVRRHLFPGLDAEAFLFRVVVHRAVGAAVVAAADGHLQQQALPLARWSENAPYVIQIRTPCGRRPQVPPFREGNRGVLSPK